MFWVNLLREFSMATNRIIQQMDVSIYLSGIYPARSNRSELMGTSTHFLGWRSKAGFPLGEFVRANREKSNLIGW